MSERQGVEIDYCPQCRGVWLDRGELDKIIQRSAQDTPPPSPAPVPQSGFLNPQHHQGQNPGYSQPYGHGQQHGHHKRKKSFIEELFD
jgi:hypothetical protein